MKLATRGFFDGDEDFALEVSLLQHIYERGNIGALDCI